MRTGDRARGYFQTLVSLVVLTAWFGSLLVAAPLQAASAVTAEPSTNAGTPSITAGPPASGSEAAPTWTFTLPADVPPTTLDPVIQPNGDTSTVTISVTHRARCAVATAPPSDPTDYVSCETAGGAPQEFTYQPTLTADGTYRLYVHDVATTTESTLTEYAVGGSDTTSMTRTPDVGADVVSADYTYAAATATPSATPTATVTPTPTPTPTPAPDPPAFTAPATSGGKAQSFTIATGANWDPALDDLVCAVRLSSDASPPAYSSCTSPYAPFTSAVTGSYDVFVRTDRTGVGSSSPDTFTYLLDATPPVLTLVSGPTGLGNDASPRWTVTSDGGEAVTCSLTAATATATIFAAGSCAPYAPGPLPDDSYTLTAQATDAAGNTTTEALATYLLDLDPPTVTVSPGSRTTSTAAAGWTVTVGSGGQPPTCVLTEASQAVGETFGSGTGCGQFAAFTLPRDGSYTLTATTADAAGNTATDSGSWYYRAPPVVSVTSPVTGNGNSNTWTVTASGTASLSCSVQRIAPLPAGTSSAVSCTAGPVTVPLPADGTYRLTAVALDPVTSASASASADFVRDTDPLPAFPVTGTSGDTTSPAVSWTWDATGSATVSCQLLESGLAVGTSVTGCLSPWTTPLTGDGDWSLRVILYDAAGNATPSVSPVVRLDRLAPAAPGVSVTGGGLTASNLRNPTWTLSGETGARFTCTWTTTVTPLPSGMPADGACANPLAPTLPNVTGSYTLTVTQSDAASNTGPTAAATYQLDVTAPVLAFSAQPAGPVNVIPVGTAWSTSGEDGASSSCTLVHSTPLGDTTLYSDQSCGRTIPVTDAGEGSYVLTVVDRDVAGNDSTPLVSKPWVIDRSNPGAPSISASSPLSPSQSPSATWTVTSNDDTGKDFVCRYDTADPTTGDFDTTGAWSTCGPVVTWDLPADGTYRVAVQSRDAAGNLSDAVVLSDPYVLDRQAPAPVVFTSAAGTGFTTSSTWTWTGETGAAATCQLQRNGVAVPGPAGAFHSCASPQTEALGAGDGTYTLLVRLTDAALNTNAAVRGPAYVLDTVTPDAPVVSGPSGPSKQTSVTWTYTTTETVTPSLLCQLSHATAATGTATIVEPLAGCTSLNRVLPTLTADGYYVLSLQLRDAAGNLSDLGSSNTYLLDTTPPALPVFSAEPTGRARFADVSWSFTRDADATAQCRLLREGQPVRDWASCGTPHGEQLAAGDGGYQLQVRLTDPVGNTTAPVSSATYTLDQTPPLAPVVTGPTGTRNVTTADYAYGSPVEAGASAECRVVVNGTPGGWAACALPRTVALGADGTYALEVRLTDAYGNLGPAGRSPDYLLDTKPPAVPAVTAPLSPAKNGNPVFTFTSDADATNACSLARGNVVVATTSGCRGTYTGAITGLADGDYVLTVVSTDAAGNTATGSSGAYTYDTTPPTPPVVTGPRGPAQNRLPLFTWTAEPGARAECSLQVEGQAPGGFVACSTPYPAPLTTDGTWVLSVRVTDAAGNTSDTGSSAGYLLDTTAPAAPLVVPPASPGRDTSPSWSAGVEPGAVTECRITGPGGVAGAFAPCTLPLQTPLGVDGSYLFEVRATDAAGNVSEIGSGSYLLDTLPPPAPVVAAPTGPGRSRAPSIAFTTEAGTTATCRVSRSSTVVSPSTPCGSPAVLDLSGQPDGGYTLSVRAVDAAGNVGPAGTALYVLDTTAPAAPTLTLVPGSPSSDRAPTYAFSAEAGATPVCRVTAPGGTARETACSGTLTLDLTGASDGAYAVSIAARDKAGNTSAPVTSTYQLDSAAGVAPRVVGPVTPDANRAPVWRVTSTGPTECRLLRNSSTFRDWAPCGASYLADLFGQPDAVYGFEARLVGSTAATFSRYRLDTTAPPVATLTAPASPSTSRRPIWTVASSELSATAECRLLVFGSVLRDWAPCAVSAEGSPYTADLTGLGDGTYTLAVRITDAARNTGPITTSDYVLDTSAPAAVGVTAPPSPANDTTPTWTISSSPGVLLECRLTSGSQVITPFVACAGQFTADLGGLPDGTYTLAVHALSPAGTPGPVTTSDYVLDTSAGDAPGALTGPTGPSRDRAPVWSFTIAAGSTATCKVSSNGRVLRDGPCSSPFTMDLSGALDGAYTLAVRAVDAAGNVSDAAVAGYVLRTVPAPAPAFTEVPGSPSSTTDPRWGFSTAPTVSAQCRRVRDGALLEDWTSCTSPVTLALVGQPDGRYGLSVRAVDAAGNTSSPISSDYVFDRSAEPLSVFLATPPSPGNDLSPTWTLGPPGAPRAALRRAALTGAPVTECRLTTPRGTGPWAPCSGSYTATTVGDGDYRLDVRAADSTGATGPASSSMYLLDTVAPAPIRFTDEPDPVGRESVATWSWVEDPRGLVECRLARPGQPAGGFTRCTSPQIVTTGTRGEGSYLLEVRPVDAAGNPGAVTSGSYRYDRTPPPAPVFTARPPSRGAEPFPTWAFSVPDDARAVCVVSQGPDVITEGPCVGQLILDLRGQQPGTWSISVRYIDTAGNAGPATTASYVLTVALGRSSGVNAPPTGGRGPSGVGADGLPLPLDRPGGPAGPQPALASRLGEVLAPLAAVPGGVRNGLRSVGELIAPGIPDGIGVPDVIRNAIGATISRPQLPLALFFIVLLFLLVQNRIDRRDPKLAAAPVQAEPDLVFGPRVGRPRTTTGGAFA